MVYTELGHFANDHVEEEEQVIVSKKPKTDTLLNFHEASSDSNGSSPEVAADEVDKEVSQY